MKFIADTSSQKVAQELAAMFPADDLTLVQIEGKYSPLDYLQECTGFRKALEIVHENRPVILAGWQTPLGYSIFPEWHALLGYPHVSFYRLPFPAYKDMRTVVEEALAGSGRPADPLAIKLLDAESVRNGIGTLRHDLNFIQDDRRAEWMQRARYSFGDLAEDELIRLVETGEAPAAGPFAGQEFLDVCVDVEGTLFDANGDFRPEIFAGVQELSGERPITVWTGGDMHGLRNKLRKFHVPWKLASKHTLRGAKVHLIIDDLDRASFTAEYGVACNTFLQWDGSGLLVPR